MFAPNLFTLTLLFVSAAQGFPAGPGSCNSPNPLGGFHLAPGFDGGTALSDFGLEVRIGGALLDPASPRDITVNTDVAIALTASTSGNDFRGFLVKISKAGLDATKFLTSDEDDGGIQQLFLCDVEQAGSLAHTNNDLKSSIAGTLFVDEEMDGVTLEVTVVIRNGVSAAGSEWYQSIYTLNVVPASTIDCFPGDSVVQVKDKGPVAMKDLVLGDAVLTDTKNNFESIYSFGHVDRKASAEFLQLKTTTTTLELTKNHMVFVEGDRAVPASSIQIGDGLIMASSGEVEAVKAIQKIVRSTGVFAPFTPSGSIVVNGVKASSFVSFQDDSGILHIGGIETGVTYQWLARAFELPHRVWCHHLGQCKNEQCTIDGVSTWVAFPLEMALWFVKQNAIVMAIVFVPVLFMLTCLWAIDFMVAYPNTVVALLAGARFLSMIRVKNKIV